MRQQNTKLDLQSIVNLVLQKGTIDEKRRNGDFHRTISFGVKPELETDDNDLVAYGNQHFNRMNKDEVNVFKSLLGSVVDFIWEIGNDMHAAEIRTSAFGNQPIPHKKIICKTTQRSYLLQQSQVQDCDNCDYSSIHVYS